MTESKQPTKAEALEALDVLESVRQVAAAAIDEAGLQWPVATRNDVATVRRYIEQAGAVPEGYALVPVEPTEEMKNACDKTPGPITAWKAWQVMLAAAPKQEATDD